MAGKTNEVVDPVLDELQSIKRLMIFSLLRSGTSQDEVADALGVSQSSVSRLFPRPNGAGKGKPGKASGSKKG